MHSMHHIVAMNSNSGTDRPGLKILTTHELIEHILLSLPPSFYPTLQLAHRLFRSTIASSPILRWLTYTSSARQPPRTLLVDPNLSIHRPRSRYEFHPLLPRIMKRLWEEIEGVNYPRSDIPFQIAEYTPGLSLEEVVWPENVFLTRPPIRKFEVTIIGASMIAELEPAIFEIPSPGDIGLGKMVEDIDLKRKHEELGLTIADFIRQLRPYLIRYRDSAQGGTEPDERFTEQWRVGQNDLCEVQLSLDPVKYVPLGSVADAQDGDASSAEAQESKRPRKWGKKKRPHKDTQTAIKFDFVIGPRWEFKMVLGSRYELGDGWHGGEADLEGIEEDVWGWPLVRGPRMRRRVGT